MKIITKSFICIAFLLCLVATIEVAKVRASDLTCDDYIAKNCPNSSEPNYKCLNDKLLRPEAPEAKSCCISVCPGSNIDRNIPLAEGNFNIFGTKFKLSAESIPLIINVIFSTVLGILSIYVLFRGIYVAGVKRTQATEVDDISKLHKELTNLVIGFLVLWGIIFIVQVVFSMLGLGSITDINVGKDNTGANVIVIGKGS